MSYKKIVAGVATFAIASAMVAPAAFADDGKVINGEGAGGGPVNEQPTVAPEGAAEEAPTFKLGEVNLTVPAPVADENLAKAAENKAAVPNYNLTTPALPEADKATVEAAISQADKAGVFVKQIGEDKFEVKDCGGTHTMNLAELTSYLSRANEFVTLKGDAVKKAEELLKKLEKFNDRTLEVKIGDHLFNNKNVVVSLKAQLEKIKGLKYCNTAMNELKMAIKWLEEQEKYVNAFMKTDPAALKEVEGKKVEKKEAKAAAAKGGKHLPKTADEAPVAPIAAVAGSAALIAAGLVASRKVNA